MTYESIIGQTINFVQEQLRDAEKGHDRWHIYRVWKMAKRIGEGEGVDMLVVELWALLHDIADAKFHGNDEEVWPRRAREFLVWLWVDADVVLHVENIVRYISFKGWNYQAAFQSPELCVVQDADRLDAIWAIGIARAFTYGWYKGRELYNPHVAPKTDMSKEEYMNHEGNTINHFYEKLLLLKERMHTDTGRSIAEQRHVYMEWFLEEFYGEWEGER